MSSLKHLKWIVPIGLVLTGAGVFAWIRLATSDLTRQVYRMGYEDYPPYYFRGKDGRPSGFSVNFTQEAARRRGIRLQWIFETAGSDAALRSNRVDLWPLLAITPERKGVVYISKPIVESAQWLIVRKESKYKSLEDLRGATICLNQLPIFAKRLLTSFVPGAHLVVMDSRKQMLESVCSQRVDAASLSQSIATETLLGGLSCEGQSLRVIQDPRMVGFIGIGATLRASAAADALRDEIGTMVLEGKRDPNFADWNYVSKSNLEAAAALVRADRRQHWLIAGICAAVSLLLLTLSLAVQIWRQRNRANRATLALKSSEERLRILFEDAPDAYCLLDSNGVLVETNKAAEELSGYSREELVGKSIQETRLLPEKEIARARTLLARIVGREPTGPDEFTLLRKDGAKGEFEIWTFPIEFEGQRIVLGAARDITKRKRAEAKTRSLSRAVEQCPVSILITDREGRIQYANPRFSEVTGYGSDEVTGREATFLDVGPEQVRGRLRDALAAGEEWSGELYSRRKNEEIFWESVAVSGIHDEAGRIGHYVIVKEDITERKRAEQELRRLKAELERENVQLREVIQTEQHRGGLLGESAGIRKVVQDIATVAQTRATVLILGETGTGKELVARAVHESSALKDKPLITVNCAALATSVIETELFGHEKGAFTGAVSRKKGRFELAAGSTIFLDEIGDLPLEVQAKLLRVLQSGEFERVGGAQKLKVDVRVIAATNRNLEQAISSGAFRADLYYRLNVFPIVVPPLRERRTDIPLLVEFFVAGFSRSLGKSLTAVNPRSLDLLMAYEWPGNVRELLHVVERAAIQAREGIIEVVDFMPASKGSDGGIDGSPETVAKLQDVDRAHVSRVLLDSRWVIDGPHGAAQRLGLHPNTLRSRMKKLGIERPPN